MKYFLVILFLINFTVLADTLTEQENIYFNFIDLNNDGSISNKEIDQIMKLIFQLLDENGDNIITKKEIIELKNIIESLS
jgi:Ca2+-binding EF-hand superfamily protein